MPKVLVKDAERMITSASSLEDGIECTFADGRSGIIPFSALRGISGPSQVKSIEIPNPCQLVLQTAKGETIEVPWDFARHYGDITYRPRIEAIASAGKESIGRRLRRTREAARLTQDQLAVAAGIGRVTIVRIENGEQSPRFETIMAIAEAVHLPVSELLTAEA